MSRVGSRHRRAFDLKPLPNSSRESPPRRSPQSLPSEWHVRENPRLTEDCEAGHANADADKAAGQPSTIFRPTDLTTSIGRARDGIDSKFAKPSPEEVKEFCLLTGGGYGDENKRGKFCIGAYVGDPGAREGNTKPTPLLRMSSRSENFVRPQLTNVRYPGRVPRDLHQNPAPAQRSTEASKHERIGAFVLHLDRPAGACDEDIILTVTMKPPAGVSAPWGAAAVVLATTDSDAGTPGDENRVNMEQVTYMCWRGQGALDTRNMQSRAHDKFCYPSTASQMVGPVKTPDRKEARSSNRAFPWSWREARVTLKRGKEGAAGGGDMYACERIRVSDESCVVQIPLLQRKAHEHGRAGAPGLAERVRRRSQVRAWALLHTIEVRIEAKSGDRRGWSLSQELHEKMWMSEGQSRQLQGGVQLLSIPEAGGGAEGEAREAREDLFQGRGFFQQSPIDHDLDFLRALDANLSANESMTVGSGRIQWPSLWRHDRSKFVTVPTPLLLNVGPDREAIKEVALGRGGQQGPWFKLAKRGDTSMHHTSPHLLRFLMENVWKLARPRLVLTVTGGARDLQLSVGQKNSIMLGLLDVAKNMKPWVITGGTNVGVMKHIGEAFAEQNVQAPLIGIVPWGVVKGRQGLLVEPADERVRPLTETFPQDYEACVETWDERTKALLERGDLAAGERPHGQEDPAVELEHNHTHFILVKDGQSSNYGSEILLRTELEACMTSGVDSYTKEILEMLEDQNLGWQGMNLQGARARARERERSPVAGLGRGSRGGPDDTVKLDAIPVVYICIEGGLGTMTNVKNAACRGIPVLIINKTGRAADLLADVSDVFDADVERDDERMKELRALYQTIDRLKSEGKLIAGSTELWRSLDKVIDMYALKLGPAKAENHGKELEMLELCREAVCTGRCYVTECNGRADSQELEGAILQSILWGWGTDRDAAESASKRLPARHLGIRYSKDLFMRKMLAAVQWNRPDVLRDFLEGCPPKSVEAKYSNRVSRGSDVWCDALDAALQEAVMRNNDKQTHVIQVLLDHGANLGIFAIDQTKLSQVLLQLPVLQHLASCASSDKGNGKQRRSNQVGSVTGGDENRASTSVGQFESQLTEAEASAEVLAGRRWLGLLSLRKKSQDARHFVELMQRAKQNLKVAARAAASEAEPQGRAQLLCIASISKKALEEHVDHVRRSDSEEQRQQHAARLVCFVKIARNLVKLDYVYRDLLGPHFRYKLGMMQPEWDLMLWSVLMNRHIPARFFWRRAPEPVISALSVVHLYRATMADVRPEILEEIRESIAEFENLALSVHKEAMKEDMWVSQQHLECPSLKWGGWTGYDLAVHGECREFVTKCCREANDARWYGDMAYARVRAKDILDRRWLGTSIVALTFLLFFFTGFWLLNVSNSTALQLVICMSVLLVLLLLVWFRSSLALWLMIYVAFFPFLWVCLLFQIGEHTPEETGGAGKLGSCVLGSDDWSWRRQDTQLVLWVVTAVLGVLFFCAPVCVVLINRVPWRDPPVLESLRAPGQLREIPAGYPDNPFANPALVAHYNYVLALLTADILYRYEGKADAGEGNENMGKQQRKQLLSWYAYCSCWVRITIQYWLVEGLTSLLFPANVDAEQQSSGLSRLTRHVSSRDVENDRIERLDLVFRHVNARQQPDLKDFLDSLNAEGKTASVEDLENYICRKSPASNSQVRFLKLMQMLRRDTDTWQNIAAQDTALLWNPSFTFFKRWLCFMRAPATIFSWNSVHFVTFVFIFSMFVCFPAYWEGPMTYTPWEELYVLINMICIFSTEVLQMCSSGDKWSCQRSYFGDKWNLFDFIAQLVFWLGFALRQKCQWGTCSKGKDFVVWDCTASPELKETCDPPQTLADGMCAEEQMYQGYKGFEQWAFSHQLYGLSCCLQWIKLLHVYSATEILGSLVLAIFRTFKHVRFFLSIVLVCVTASGIALHVGRTKTDCPDSSDPHGAHGQCLSFWWWIRTYLMGYGELFLDEIKDVMSMVLLCLTLLVVQLILMNTVFVAVIQSTFEEVMHLSKQEWMISLYHLTEEFVERSTVIPIPFNFFYYCRIFIEWMLGCCCFWKGRMNEVINEQMQSEISAGLIVSSRTYLEEHNSNPRFKTLEIIPIELKGLHEKKQKQQLAHAGSFRAGLERQQTMTLRTLDEEEKRWQHYILSLRKGDALFGRAKQQFLRKLEAQQGGESMESTLMALSDQLARIDKDIIRLTKLTKSIDIEKETKPPSGRFV